MLDFDELNSLVSEKYEEAETQDDLVDEALDILINIYLMGAEAVEDMLDYQLDMGKSISDMQNTIYLPIEGKTFEDRIREYAEVGDLPAIQKVMATEGHRIYNASSNNMAEAIANDSGRNVGKKWVTMKDDRVRDTHDYLDGMVVPLNEKFYTYNNNATYYPGQFGIAEEDINCRCAISYIWTP